MSAHSGDPGKVGAIANGDDHVVEGNVMEVRLFRVPDHDLPPVPVNVLYLGLVKVSVRAEITNWAHDMGWLYATGHHFGQHWLGEEKNYPY